MTEKEIFEHLIAIAPQSSDIDGVVTSCLVREGEIVMDAVSAGSRHAEYQLLEKLKQNNEKIMPDDIVYVSVQPCDSRTPGKEGEGLGDCTTNLIKGLVRNVVYGAMYTRSETSNSRFAEAGVSVRQIDDIGIVRSCIKLFNDTNENPKKHLPVV